MKSMVGYTAGALIAVGLILLAAFSYYIYSPLPKAPRLSGHASPRTLQVGRHLRSYVEYVPAGLPRGAPLVIVLHGWLMTGEMMREMTAYEFDLAADRGRFVVLYPDAYGRSWYDCRKDRLAKAKQEHVDDVGFVRALIAAEQARRGIDPKKVFAVGFSGGGHMAMDLAEEYPSPVAGVAVFAANVPVRAESACPHDTITTPMMLVEGTDDPINPFHGGEESVLGLQNDGTEMSAMAGAEALARRDRIRTPDTRTILPHRDADDPTRVEKLTWWRDGKPYIVLFDILGGGHVVPQREYRFPRLFGRTSHDIDGPKQAIDFFLHR